MKKYFAITTLVLSITVSHAAEKSVSPTAKSAIRKVASDDATLFDCQELRIKYSAGDNFLDGLNVGKSYYAEDAKDGQTYPVYIGNLNSEGGSYIVENFRSNVSAKIVSSGPRSMARKMSLSNGQSYNCSFVPPKRR